MSALLILGELNLVDGEEVESPVKRHGLYRTNEIGGLWRNYFLFPRDQSDIRRPFDRDNPFIYFAGKQPQRQADDSIRVSHHSLNSKMGLSCICGTEDCRDLTGTFVRGIAGVGVHL